MFKGISLSILASALFGCLYFFTTLLKPLSGAEIFGWRMLLTLPVISLFLVLTRDWILVREVAFRIRREGRLWWALPLSALMLGVQLWLFLWAPLHGHALNVSLGYFMMPLVMVLIGRFHYGEKLTRLQVIAVLLALAGVVNAVAQAGGFAWTSLLVCLGYPYYFVLRKQIGTNNLGGLWFDMLLMTPLALYFALTGSAVGEVVHMNNSLPGLIVLLGILSAAALIAYILSSRLLPFTLFGLLGYVEPVLLVLVSLLLGEQIATREWPTFIAIWMALAFLAAEGFMNWRRQTGRRPS